MGVRMSNMISVFEKIENNIKQMAVKTSRNITTMFNEVRERRDYFNILEEQAKECQIMMTSKLFIGYIKFINTLKESLELELRNTQRSCKNIEEQALTTRYIVGQLDLLHKLSTRESGIIKEYEELLENKRKEDKHVKARDGSDGE